MKNIKVLCYGVKEIEKKFFYKLNEKYNYNLTFAEDLLTNENVSETKGFDAIILFADCNANARNLKLMKENGVKYILTRTAGFDHIDKKAAQELGYIVANVPNYSPVAVASYAFVTGLSLVRKISYINNKILSFNFTVDSQMLAKEFENLTIGIIGVGKIGLQTAKLWKSIGTIVLGYDEYEKEEAKQVVKFVKLDELLANSDLISLHIPYLKGINDNFVNKEFINKMKQDSIIINASRKEIVEIDALLLALKNNKLWGFGADVFEYENEVLNKTYSRQTLKKEYPELLELIDFYPRVLISPHIAYFTDKAVSEMIEISYKNLKQIIETNSCDNEI